jgi:alanine racemase
MENSAIPEDLRTWAEIDHTALLSNLRLIRGRTGGGAGILAVVKANAYGHGAIEVAGTLAAETSVFGVANLGEAREIESAGTGRDIMLLSPCLPGERAAAVGAGHIATVSSAAEAAAYAHFGKIRLNFKIDTGMGRLGCLEENAAPELRKILETPNTVLHSISTHLPSADEDAEFTAAQLGRFASLASELRKLAPNAKFHALNSAGILTRPAEPHELVRPGLAIYGCTTIPGFDAKLRPALAWRARIALVKNLPAGASVSYGRSFISSRPIRTAIVPVGYADGFPRQASGHGARVLVRGVSCPVLGRVTMDQIVIDATAVPGVREGDTATLMGADGAETITAGELAACSGTIAWDILTGIGRRVARFHHFAAGVQ